MQYIRCGSGIKNILEGFLGVYKLKITSPYVSGPCKFHAHTYTSMLVRLLDWTLPLISKYTLSLRWQFLTSKEGFPIKIVILQCVLNYVKTENKLLVLWKKKILMLLNSLK